MVTEPTDEDMSRMADEAIASGSVSIDDGLGLIAILDTKLMEAIANGMEEELTLSWYAERMDGRRVYFFGLG